jgi:hypothetical protein
MRSPCAEGYIIEFERRWMCVAVSLKSTLVVCSIVVKRPDEEVDRKEIHFSSGNIEGTDFIVNI